MIKHDQCRAVCGNILESNLLDTRKNVHHYIPNSMDDLAEDAAGKRELRQASDVRDGIQC